MSTHLLLFWTFFKIGLFTFGGGYAMLPLIQSEVAALRPFLARTMPASWMAPPYHRSFSVSVVLPASGCEMMAKVRRRATISEMDIAAQR